MKRIDPDTETTVRCFLALIAERYEVAGAILYGSRARGTHDQDSDADVAVLLGGEPQHRLQVRLDMAGTAFDVMLDTGVLISPFPIWVEEWKEPENFANPQLLYNIDREGIRM